MTEMLWIGLPILVSVGSGMLAYFVMKARMEAAIARERSALAEARARLEGQAKTLAETCLRCGWADSIWLTIYWADSTVLCGCSPGW